MKTITNVYSTFFCLVLLLAGIALQLNATAKQQAATAAAQTPNYAGTWILDKAKSESLPQAYQEAGEIEMTIAQDSKQMTLEFKGLTGRQAMMARPVTYKLDGTPTTSELTDPVPAKVTAKAKMSSDNKMLELNTVRNAQFQGNEVTFTTADRMELSADGKMLRVARTVESPRGTQQVKLAFNKK